jgi:hypothetical protein
MEETMKSIPISNEAILRSKTRRGTPAAIDFPKATTTEYIQALDNFHRVFGIRTGDHVVMLTDPLLDPRVVQAVQGLAKARGATFISYMGESTRYVTVPDEAKALLERATFVVSTWFASVFDPFCQALRRKKGQRWVKITFFRNIDLWNTPQARFPVEIVGELVRATSRLYPDNGPFDLRITDRRGTDFRVPFTDDMRQRMKRDNRWRGRNCADEDGCYVHYIATHGPNIYDPMMFGNDPDMKVGINGVIRPQWAVGFDKPFDDPPAVEFRDDRVVAVHGESEAADILREFLIGGTLEELGCGHNPKAPRFDIYPAGPNSPGALHFGINGLKESAYLRRTMPNWEEPHVHMDLVSYDCTVTAGNRTLIDDGYLMSLSDPEVIACAKQYGDPLELLEQFPTE